MRWRHALIVAVALLAISAAPVSAQNASAVASEHTTFGTGSSGEPAPAQTANMSVQGGGESASVSLNQSGFFEDFEAGSLSDSWQYETGEYSVVDTASQSGSYALEHDGSTGANFMARGADVSGAARIEGWVQTFDNADNVRPGFGIGIQDGSTGYHLFLEPTDNEIEIDRRDSGSATVLNTTSVSITDDTWYYLIAERRGDDLHLSVYDGDPDSGGSLIADVVATDTTYTTGKLGVGSISYGRWDDIESSGRAVSSGTYVSATHNAEQIQGGWTNLTLDNASADVTWQADPGGDGTWTNVSSQTVTSTANVSQDLSGTTSERWRVRVDIETAGDGATAEIHDEGLLFEPAAPTLSDADPTGEIADYDGDISINVSDRDLGLAQGDTVVVEAQNESGGQIGQQSVTSNGTVSFDYSALAGPNTIEWTATDEYGKSDSTTQDFSTPATVEVRNETGDRGLITTEANITATTFAGDQVANQTISDGKIDLTGAPATEKIVIRIRADNYYTRSVVIDSIFEQQTAYILSENESAVEVRFTLRDATGNFPEEASYLYINKPLQINNSTKYRVVSSSDFGVAGYTTNLAEDRRYRLVIENDDGDRRVLGSYEAEVAENVQLDVGETTYDLNSLDGGGVEWGTGTAVQNDTQYIQFTYQDLSEQTTSLSVEIYERGNESNVIFEETYRNLGNLTLSEPVPEQFQNKTFTVDWTAERDDEELGAVAVAGGPSVSLVPNLAPIWMNTISAGLLLVVGALFGGVRAELGAVVTSLFAGLLWWLGMLPAGVGGGAVVLALFVAILYNLREVPNFA